MIVSHEGCGMGHVRSGWVARAALGLTVMAALAACSGSEPDTEPSPCASAPVVGENVRPTVRGGCDLPEWALSEEQKSGAEVLKPVVDVVVARTGLTQAAAVERIQKETELGLPYDSDLQLWLHGSGQVTLYVSMLRPEAMLMRVAPTDAGKVAYVTIFNARPGQLDLLGRLMLEYLSGLKVNEFIDHSFGGPRVVGFVAKS
jgi:hypothetical protein